MSGGSYMIPFVVAGGILLSLPVVLSTGTGGVPPEGTFLASLFSLGVAGLGFIVPIFSGYVAFSIADRVGIAPGVIGGSIAVSVGAGFLGGIVSGMLAGIVAFYLKKIKVPASVRSVMPILVIPLVSTFTVWVVMAYGIGRPIAALMTLLNSFLGSMAGANTIILGLVVGAMIGFDLGGPVNKVAFTFGATVAMDSVTTWGAGYLAAMDVAICVPPLGLAIATFVQARRFTREEREAGKSALVMGLVGITEGAIPFAAGDPLRVIASTVTGSAVGAAVAMGLSGSSTVAWGGLVGLAGSSGVGQVAAYGAATLVGAIVTAVMVCLLKRPIPDDDTPPTVDAGASEGGDEFALSFE
jgi:fructose-specific PTS system IIC-like component